LAELHMLQSTLNARATLLEKLVNAAVHEDQREFSRHETGTFVYS